MPGVCTYVLNLLLGFFNNRPIAYIVEMENKTDKNGKNTSFVEILAVLRCDFTILFRALSFSLDFIRFVHSGIPEAFIALLFLVVELSA